ncbi:MAG: hypothetical protein A3D67_00590 [Candidatus Lloydbacteria bacterium RIFCSPHIGHO2_02_FULL_51_22]|uniref:YgjP-like metallopeptidase domain-containing protein n=2 Tax=Candidatus Lloydiibacteriota TaxID=1817910 RepID=A0A1G2DD15_9BACT|nr:MAG: hypothetical protein A3D67_00590 [Candidatus Lloydbacteria bacterium RIFCSPHIGHO2_02_FULL_51_22]OGZ16439.1 MAG: hypothetical protein A3G11_00930 [Candidatus Lloydbacteria bacterium RIFCSPLOWO2_12_FULL_51_9]
MNGSIRFRRRHKTWRCLFVSQKARHIPCFLYRLRGEGRGAYTPPIMPSPQTHIRRLRLKGERIPYAVRRSPRTKRVSLTMSYDGSLVVSAPERAALSLIENFIQEKSGWILKNFLYFKNFKGKIFSGDRKEFLFYKERAQTFVLDRIAHWNARGTFPVEGVQVKYQRAQWGSCSDKKNLNFNYKILFLPPRLADYVIVHELCHTRELNHSARFWRLVGDVFPSYEHLEKELKNYRIG